MNSVWIESLARGTEFGNWITSLLALQWEGQLGGYALAAFRAISMYLVWITLTRSRGRHWALQTWLIGTFALLFIDVVVGVASNRAQGLSLALGLRNIFLWFGLFALSRNLLERQQKGEWFGGEKRLRSVAQRTSALEQKTQ